MSLSWSQSHVNSLSQLAPMYHNVLAQTSQINFLQQQQQPNNQQQSMQSQQYYCYPANQQGNYAQNQIGQPYQQETYGAIHPQQETYGAIHPQQQIPRPGVGNLGQPIGQTAYNIPSIMQNQAHGYGSLPAHILDQIRAYIGTPPPIFILPNNCPSAVAAPQSAITPGPSVGPGCPGIGINCPSTPVYCSPGSCYPYPMTMPVYNPFVGPNQNNSKETSKNCGCCARKGPDNSVSRTISTYGTNEPDGHRCIGGIDDTVCNKRNCPSAINLQALASQLLAIQGIIPCAATRLVLRKVAGSNITSSMEETIERAKRSLCTLTQEQLLSETRNAQQVNALINLHMTANPPANVIPILTTVQLKVNLLKAHVDSSINRRLSESQGAEGNGSVDPVILALKSDQELRELLGTLRQKECEERVNLNFAPYRSQRVIAESRLNNIQNKISQVESEMEKRRGANLPRSTVAQQFSDPGWYGYTGDVSNSSSFGGGLTRNTQNYESPDPFRFPVRNPKHLIIQPHVGSPATTYERPKKSSTTRPSRARKDSDDEDCDDNAKNSARDPSSDNHRCACEKSSEDDSADEGKKKLGGKILVGKDLGSMIESDQQIHSGVSILKLSKNVLIVIDDPCGKTRKKEDSGDKKIVGNKIKNEKKTVIDDSERPNETKTKNSVGTMISDSDNATTSGATAEKTKKFKWGKKTWGWEKDDVDPPEVKVEPKNKTEENSEIVEPVKDVKQSHNTKRIDYFHESNGPEPIREQTVRMITKIDYEPSVFRAFLNPVDEPPEKERVVAERFKGSFTEDSLKSTSTESTVNFNRTPESLSLHIEELEQSCPSPIQVPDDVVPIVETSPIEVFQSIEAIAEEEKKEQDGIRINDKISNNSRRIHRSGPSRHNDGNEGATCGKDQHEKDVLKNKEGTENYLISGALTTIGNHVASFGSIISKIASLKLHQVAESSQTLFGDSSTNEPNEIDPSVNESEAGYSGTAREKSITSDINMKKEIGRWKYIKFADFDDSASASTGGESSNSESSALPKIKHSVIEDKSRGSKYVVIEEPSEALRQELGEPYKTERSLVIRSRPKSPQSPSSVQSGPFTVVKGPKRRANNCLALHFVSPKSSKQNRRKDSHDLKSSSKFWFRPETHQEQRPETNEMHEIVASGSRAETLKLMTNNLDNGKKAAVADSGTSVNDEHIVEVHEYSKISVTSNRTKLLPGSGKIDNTDTVISSIA